MDAPNVTPVMRPYLRMTAMFPAGRDTPRDFLERCLAALDGWEPKIGAFVTLNLAGARAAADRSSERWRDSRILSAIDGMPIGVKDIIETIDMPTQNGSPLFDGFRSERDGASVAALREAGAVILGKTVTTEFAATEPRGTRNPWDQNRTPGGSSSGSAAAVAVGAISAGLGTQVLGSIVRPASFCGCFGFKPTVGAINRGGSYDGLSQSVHGPRHWRNSNPPASRSRRVTTARKSPPPKLRSKARASSLCGSTPGSRVGRSTLIGHATRASSARRCSIVGRRPRR